MENGKRGEVRRLLALWGATTQYCADLHRQMSEYQALIESALGLSAATMDGMPRGQRISDPTARQAVQLEMLTLRYAERVDDLWSDICERLAVAHSIESAMIDLDPVEHAVIKYRYEEKKTYRAIGQIMSYSEDHVKRVEGAAVDKIARAVRIEAVG